MRKILFITTIPLTIKAFFLDYMKFLRAKGYNVQAAGSEGEESEVIQNQGFCYHTVQMARNISPIRDYEAFIGLRSLMKKEKYDLVHTETSKAGLLGRLAARAAGVPAIVHTCGGWPFHDFLPRAVRFFYVMLERLAASKCDAIIAVSKKVEKEAFQFKIAPPEKIFQIYNGIDLKRFYPYDVNEREKLKETLGVPRGKIIIGCISRFVPDKGIEIFLSAARKLKDNDSLVFVLGGDGSLKREFERNVSEWGLKDKVIFTGHIEDTAQYLNTFDIFCLPTLREGFGVIFAEAQACAVSVIASDIAPLDEVVKNECTGVLVPAGDADKFAQAIERLLVPEVREKMGFLARKHVEEKFNARDINDKMFNLYSKLWG
ncbi:MAG: glycosyltransferase family 4 protein [Candidatus Omnitrophota bacterium]